MLQDYDQMMIDMFLRPSSLLLPLFSFYLSPLLSSPLLSVLYCDLLLLY